MNAEKTGKMIYELRTKKNLTQKQLSELINVSDKAISKWERGDGCPDVNMIPILAKVLEVDIETILDGELSLNQLQNKTGRNVKLYDFKRPDKWSKTDFNIIWNLFDKIAQRLSTTFANGTVHIAAVDQLINIEFAQSIPSNSFISEYSYKQGGFVIEVDPALGKELLKQDAAKYPEIQTFDLDVMSNYFSNKIALELEQAITERIKTVNDKADDIAQKIHRPFTTYTSNIATLLQIPYQMLCLVTLACTVGGVNGNINIQISDVYMAQLRKLGFFEKGFQETQFEYLSDIKAPDRKEMLSVEFGRFANTNTEFEEGKILVLQKKFYEPLNVIYKNKVIHTGEAVVIDENFGIRITDSPAVPDITYNEETYLAVRLGVALLLPEEIEALQTGSVLELNAIAGTPSAIIKNGQVVAHGEIVVCDDNFGIRITA